MPLRSAHPARNTDSLRIAMVGTRGVPAAYGGFETAIEEIGQRLVTAGHDVTVYCRPNGAERPPQHLGMDLVHLPALRAKSIETLSHTALSSLHFLGAKRHDVAYVFNAANAPFVPFFQARGAATAVHVDGLEWKRDKWGKWGQRYYRLAEEMSVRQADALISDARGIADYYEDEFGIDTELLTYGTRVLRDHADDRLAELGLTAGGFHLVVARFEPENHVDVIVEGYTRSDATLPLVVVGSAPYAAAYTDRIARTAEADPRIKMLGGVWDQELLDQLYTHALTYLHGHSVGGTNPSLLRAMGAGTAVIGWDVGFNREVAGESGRWFANAAELARAVEAAEEDLPDTRVRALTVQARAESTYNWDDVAAGYEDLARRLAAGQSSKGTSSGRRRQSAWSPTSRSERQTAGV